MFTSPWSDFAHMYTALRAEGNLNVKNGHRSKFSNLSNCKEEAKKKKAGLQRGSADTYQCRNPSTCKLHLKKKKKPQQEVISINHHFYNLSGRNVLLQQFCY